MMFCKNCGSELLDRAEFCGKCGTRVSQPLKKLCPNCKNELDPNTIFCSKCGAKVDVTPNPNIITPIHSVKNRAISITRESQFQCMANTYKVIVNGNDLGNISAGKTLSTSVMTEQATVEIICTTIMISAKLRTVLQLGENTKITFKVQWPGSIFASVQGAKILEQSR